MSADEVRQDLLAWIVANATQPCSIEDIHSDVTFVGRLRKATEGAAKDNIKQGVTEIVRLDL